MVSGSILTAYMRLVTWLLSHRAPRAAEFPQVGDPGEGMAVLAWSYAATVHLNLPPQVVFHANGYRGQANSLIEEFQAGRCIK